MQIELRDISKTIGTYEALRHINLTIPDGSLVVILGPSGSGKTTLLRIISGLERPDEESGPILFNGKDVSHHGVGSRGIGFVFQHYALFRHMTVFDNIAFGLRMMPKKERPAEAIIRERVHQLLELVQLQGLAQRYPNHLSGGQRQRVALARALAVEPKVLLLDEPFGALDAKVRLELRRWLRHLHDDIHVTSVFVTHDQEEALEVADYVVVMNHGHIEQMGSPDDIFHHPKTPFVMDFIGQVNQFKGQVIGDKVVFESLVFNHAIPTPGHKEARIYVRPHDLEIHNGDSTAPALPVTVRRILSTGPQAKVELETSSGQSLVAVLPHYRFISTPLNVGSEVFVSIRECKVFALEESLG
jgi:sulfate/thiosulfate transport system ATP-binding protein